MSQHQFPGPGVMTLAAVFVSVLAIAPARAEIDDIQMRPRARYDTTLTVAPVPGSPEASGQALKAALETLSIAKADRCLVKLEPGVYDVGEVPLVLVPGIDVEGSGALQTEIVGLGQDFDGASFSFHQGVVVGADHVEMRNLTVRCDNTNHLDACIAMSNYRASPRLVGVRLLATDPQGKGHWGLRNDESSPTLDEVEILAANGGNNYAVVNAFTGSRPAIRRSSLTARDGTGHNIGILNKADALAELREVEIGAAGGELAAGVWSIEPQSGDATLLTLEMFDVGIEARDADENVGVFGGSATFELRKSRVSVDRGSALDIGPYGNVDVRNSELRATDFLAHAGNVVIVATRLLGGGDVMGYGEETCLGIRTDDGTTNVCP